MLPDTLPSDVKFYFALLDLLAFCLLQAVKMHTVAAVRLSS